jgi:hypothetical protein
MSEIEKRLTVIRTWIIERLDQPDQIERYRQVVGDELDRRLAHA